MKHADENICKISAVSGWLASLVQSPFNKQMDQWSHSAAHFSSCLIKSVTAHQLNKKQKQVNFH